MSGAVVAILRYPVKSAGGQALQVATCVASGLQGDRAWGVLRPDGTVASAKSPARGGRLLHAHARQERDAVWLDLPQGGTFPAGTAACDAALSSFLGEAVVLSRKVPLGLRLHRLWPGAPGMIPDWQPALPGTEAVTAVAGAVGGSFRDFGAVHVVTTGALARLEAQQGQPVDPLRFRPNLVVDLPEDPPPGTVLRIGEVLLRVSLPTPRCVVPALRQPGLDDMPELLSTLAREYRQPVRDLGRAACFGFYADVKASGQVAVGATVEVP